MDVAEEIQELDEGWIKEFEENDKNFEIFYSDDVYYVKLHCIYIDKLSNIEKVKEEKIFLNSQNFLSREEILGILKNHSFQNNIKYSVMSILKYNIDIEPLDIKHFLKSKNTHISDQYSFLTPIKNIDSITFKKTISMFHDLNNIFIIFYEKDKTHMITREHMTKKVYLSNTHKKTIKKTT
jgi:hypothetical protein